MSVMGNELVKRVDNLRLLISGPTFSCHVKFHL